MNFQLLRGKDLWQCVQLWANCKILSVGQLSRLQRLYLKGMQELQELEELQDKRPQGNNVILEKLKIHNCSKLTKLPSFPKLRKLKIKVTLPTKLIYLRYAR